MDKDPVRILRIIARLNVGGPAIQAISLSGDLNKDNYKTLLVCGKVGPYEGDMSYLARKKGVHSRTLSRFGREISPIDDLNSLWALRTIIKQFRPHIIHTHTAKAGTLGRLAGVLFNMTRPSDVKAKLVHTFHGHTFHSYFSGLRTFFFIQIERFLSKLTDKIVVISPLQKEDICRTFKIAPPEKVTIIPLGFELTPFIGCEKRRSKIRDQYFPFDTEETLLVGIIGRLTHVKNHRMFLDAVKYLKDLKKIRFFRFIIIGDGELKEDLMMYAAELELEESVVFTGWQKDMPLFYGAMDIVALTSLNEGTPVTLIEAMAAAKPVVATNVGGVSDLLGMVDGRSTEGYIVAQNGILVPAGKAEILAKALLFLLENRDKSKEMGKRGREYVLNHYSMERLVKDIESLYKELLELKIDD